MPNTIAEPTVQPRLNTAEEPCSPGVPPRLLSQTLLLLSLGHLSVDLFSIAVPTLQPILVERFSLSLTQAGLVGGTFMLASSVMQLPFGVLSDRLHSRLFTVLAPLTAGVFLSSLPAAAGLKTLLLLVAAGGLGVAAFHPQSATHATSLSGERRGLAMAFFITSGWLGMALGPTYFSFITTRFGFDWLYLAVTPAVVSSLILLRWLPPPANSHVRRGTDMRALRAVWKPLALHYTLVVVRSAVQVGISQFLTLYLYRDRGFSFAQTSLALTLFFASAAAGSFLGGNLADRTGGKTVVALSMIGCVPFLWLFLATDGWLSLLGLFAGGLILLLTMPVNVVMAQALVPSQAGTVAALIMGFAWGMAGVLFIPAEGWLADRVGLEAVFWGVTTLPIAGFLLSLRLPSDTRAARPASV